ncbi:MAG: hypothetical protein IPM85_17075 [Chitinophagaceae bacterium]|nr:hypothetical protein [Chitinophagaceae bacterium]
MKFLLYAFLIYLLYLLVFRLVIPIYITTRKVKQGFREMQQKNGGANAQPAARV